MCFSMRPNRPDVLQASWVCLEQPGAIVPRSAPPRCFPKLSRLTDRRATWPLARFCPVSTASDVEIHGGLVANDPCIMPGRDVSEVTRPELFLGSIVSDTHPS